VMFLLHLTVDGDAVYFPTGPAISFAVKKDSVKIIWSHKISEYDGVEGAYLSRRPCPAMQTRIIGDILNSKQVRKGANVISVDRETGNSSVEITQVEIIRRALLRISGCLRRSVYIGFLRGEETLAQRKSTYPGCSSRQPW